MTPQTKSTRNFKVVLASAFLLACVGTVWGQTTSARPDRGMVSGASYSVSDIENISLTNGNVNLSIPLAALPSHRWRQAFVDRKRELQQQALEHGENSARFD